MNNQQSRDWAKHQAEMRRIAMESMRDSEYAKVFDIPPKAKIGSIVKQIEEIQK